MRLSLSRRAACRLMAAASSSAAWANQAAYEPNWQSLSRHAVPEWFHDAKLGIFVHWGLYSVPAWAPLATEAMKDAAAKGDYGRLAPTEWMKANPYAEWYLNTLLIEGSPTAIHHRQTYGSRFSYLDFIPEFNRAIRKWNPASMADAFLQAGARYVVLTTKHHDGFTLWPSRVVNPYRRPHQRAAARDLVGELSSAVRKHGLQMGLYYSGGLDWSFGGSPIVSILDLRRTNPETAEYAAYADAHWRELLSRYQPSILWNDITYPKLGQTARILAEAYNQDPDIVVNDRFAAPHSDYLTPEYRQFHDVQAKKWEICRGMGGSFGFNTLDTEQSMLSGREIIHLLVDVVSKNGNLLLNVGPKADGSIPESQQQRLQVLGRWLRQNGGAIYGTRPWKTAQATAGDVPVRFTAKRGVLNAILLKRPPSGEIVIPGVVPETGSTIRLLGVPTALPWTRSEAGARVTLPAELPGEHAWTLQIAPAGGEG